MDRRAQERDAREGARHAAQILSGAGAPAAGEEAKTATFSQDRWAFLAVSRRLRTRETPSRRTTAGPRPTEAADLLRSFNFLLGVRRPQRTLLQNIELKWLLQGSDSPFDSIGFGVALRGSYAKRFGLNFDLLAPFIGWTWTEPAEAGQKRVFQTRFGLSMNINKALEWVK